MNADHNGFRKYEGLNVDAKDEVVRESAKTYGPRNKIWRQDADNFSCFLIFLSKQPNDVDLYHFRLYIR